MAEERKEEGGEVSEYSSEDEGTEDYKRGGYHPVRIGDAFKNGRYVVLYKLGWGHFSTVWLASDTLTSHYVALKVQKSAQHYTEAAVDEIKVLKQIADGDPDDKKCVVKLLDHFKHSGPNGQHMCMVFEYLGDTLLTLIKYSNHRGLPLHMVKQICFQILVGLDYLHHNLSIIHTDLKPENVLLLSAIDPSKDPRKSVAPLIFPPKEDKIQVTKSIASKDVKSSGKDLTKNQKKKIQKKAAQSDAGYEASEENKADSKTSNPDVYVDVKSNRNSVEAQQNFSVIKHDSAKSGGTKDANQRNQSHRRPSSSARKKLLASVDLKCKLVDFGNACWTYRQFTNYIQTRQYRCPEVILGAKYSTSADLWSFVCICFELVTGDLLFDPHSGDNYDRDEDHLALMMELIGMMPRKIALGGRYSRDFFDRHGDLRHIRNLHVWPIKKVLQEKYALSEQDANDMADFLVPLLNFVPEKRPTAAQCLNHPWISAGPRLLEPSVAAIQPQATEGSIIEKKSREKDEREAMEARMRSIAIDRLSKPPNEQEAVLSSPWRVH